jgi:2-C-methyl-D-erythritol 4-phosphate cytidylyltransferase/2-C-methyl-D-erythritol 2,4-cyclodiphosphate synthase
MLTGLAGIEEIAVVLPPGGCAWTPPRSASVAAVPGGERRQDSVMAGLGVLGPGITHVLVHDAARPFAGAVAATRVMRAAERTGAAIPVLPVGDTLKTISGGLVSGTVDRSGLWASQTPQGFRRDILVEALSAAGDVTDECAALEKAGRPVSWVEGDPAGAKLTRPSDLDYLSRLAPVPDTRTGLGIDFHPFSRQRPLHLCGLLIEGEQGLDGHSDGDAALHAVADAVLSAACAGDIGTLFPPGEERWKGADSGGLLAAVVDLVRQAGWRVRRVDLTIVGERPRISPMRTAMIERLSSLLGVDAGSVWIKGTTTNTLGDIGRGLGLSALAMAELERVRP